MAFSFLYSRWLWLAAVGLAGGLLAACAQPPAAGPDAGSAFPEFGVVVDKAGDRVAVTSDEDRAVFDVWSETGIGGASVSLTAGDMPPALLLRLHLRGLEQMTFAYDDTVVSLSVPSGAGRPVLRSVVVHGDEMPVTPQSPHWVDVTLVDSADSATGGYFQVAAPQAFFDAATAQFQISWIDFYR